MKVRLFFTASTVVETVDGSTEEQSNGLKKQLEGEGWTTSYEGWLEETDELLKYYNNNVYKALLPLVAEIQGCLINHVLNDVRETGFVEETNELQ